MSVMRYKQETYDRHVCCKGDEKEETYELLAMISFFGNWKTMLRTMSHSPEMECYISCSPIKKQTTDILDVRKTR